jgi:hypothetical protein
VSYGRNYRRPATRPASTTDGKTALVTPRQMAALDKMATAHDFTSGSALLADVASCTLAELGRKSRPAVQMFVDQAFTRYGRASRPRGRCEDAPCCGCCD